MSSCLCIPNPTARSWAAKWYNRCIGHLQKARLVFRRCFISKADNEFKIKSLYKNDLILNVATKLKENL